jgi:hypothetical protein
MKKITLFLFLSMVVVFSAEAHKYKNAKVTISIQTFYDQLSPYGDWIYSPDYGYVWRPYFDHPESFRPYSSNGNWVYTNYGWTWASGYDWGWATFHYGRWDFDNYLGWMWIPGYEWAPAWVSWGSYNNYWGWAPLGPNIYVNSNWYAPDPWWTFVARDHFCSGNWNRYIYNHRVNVTHITHITNVYVDKSNNHNSYNSWYNGPRVTDVDKYSRSKVKRIEIGESQRPEKSSVHNNRMNIYRPKVENKRSDYRPADYRSTEQARNGKRIEQSNARTNDPGANRTRESRPEIHSTMQTPSQRSSNVTRAAKVEPRNVAQNPEARVSSRQAVEPKNETPAHGTRPNVTEGKHPVTNTSRMENAEKSQSRKNTPAIESRKNSSSRETGNNRTTNAQPTRENRTREVTPSSNSSTGNTKTQKTTREDVKKSVSESKKALKSSEKRSAGKPANR